MNLPKDWSKKPDWLDKASAPSEGGFKVFLSGVALLAIVGGLGAFVFSMLGL